MAWLFKPLTENSRPAQHFLQLAAAHEHIRNCAVWRIVHPAAEAQFFVIKSGEIMLRCVSHSVVIGKVGLQNDFSWLLSASSSPGDLREQLKGALGGAKIRKSQRGVSANHSH